MLLKDITVALLAALPFLAAPTLALVATDGDDGRVILCQPVREGDRFVLSYTHSMYGGEVREEYAATGDGQLRRLSMTTANAAAADYYAYTATVVREGERFRVEVPPASFRELVVRVDRVGQPRLAIGGDTLSLFAAMGDDHRVRLAIERSAVWQRLLGGAC